MPLIKDLNTKLKSIPYGNDRPKGGSSNEPYIQKNVDVPKTEFLGSDSLLRGGILAPIRAVEDVTRLGKMFADLKSANGLLFIAKQNILSRQLKTLETPSGIYTGASTLLNAAGGFLGLHVPLFENFIPERNRYFKTVFDKNKIEKSPDNRLVKLSKGGIIYQPAIGINKNKPEIDQVYGINGTGINGLIFDLKNNKIFKNLFSDGEDKGYYNKVKLKSDEVYGKLPYRTDNIEYSTFFDHNKTKTLDTVYKDDLKITPGGSILASERVLTQPEPPDPKTKKSKVNIQSGELKGQTQTIQDKVYEGITITPSGSLTPTEIELKEFKELKNKTLEQLKKFHKVNIQSKILSEKDLNKTLEDNISYVYSLDKGVIDKINTSDIETINSDSTNEVNKDLIQFSISIVNNDVFGEEFRLNFRAFIDTFSDGYTSEWKDIKYSGRGEKFYNYGGFDRKISLGFSTYAQSKGELIPMYEKLNYLASSLAPSYSGIGYMRGNLIRLTVGNYIKNQLGIIMGGFTYDMSESIWDIDEGLPMMIKVTGFSFVPIHEFIPELGQRFIATNVV